MMRAAIYYAAHGFRVLPVARGKGPLCQHGVHSATTDSARIRTWWTRSPGANIAVACDRFWVLDVDPRNGGDDTLSDMIAQHGPLPRTWTARTGSGGSHHYFEHEPRFEAIPLGRLADGIDIKGNSRHYVLVPPSRSSSGPYQWRVTPREPLARAPEWLVNMIVRAKTLPAPAPAPRIDYVPADRRLERARRYARALDPAISGSGGHSATFRAAMVVARGFALNENEAVHVLASEWNPGCQPPWTERDLRRKVREALRCGSMPVGGLLG